MSIFNKKNQGTNHEKKHHFIDKDALLAGEKLVMEMQADSDDNDDLPSNIQIDFASLSNKKELLKYLCSLTENNFDAPKTVKYKAIKYNDGFIFEIQEGGNGKGYLSSVLKLLEAGSDVVLVLSSERRVRISREGKNIKTIQLSEDDDSKISSDALRDDKLENLFTPSIGFFLFGFSFAILGIVSVLLGLSFKYIILNENKRIVFDEKKYDTPYQSFNNSGIYTSKEKIISKMTYSKNSGWEYTEKKRGEK